MYVGIVVVELVMPYLKTLKEKRQVVKSLIDKLRNRFNASVSEIDHQNTITHSDVAVAVVSGDRKTIDSLINKISNYIEDHFSDVVYAIHSTVEQF